MLIKTYQAASVDEVDAQVFAFGKRKKPLQNARGDAPPLESRVDHEVQELSRVRVSEDTTKADQFTPGPSRHMTRRHLEHLTRLLHRPLSHGVPTDGGVKRIDCPGIEIRIVDGKMNVCHSLGPYSCTASKNHSGKRLLCRLRKLPNSASST